VSLGSITTELCSVKRASEPVRVCVSAAAPQLTDRVNYDSHKIQRKTISFKAISIYFKL